jgi:hypothetical protein
MKPMDVSIQDPQLQPPPPSGASSMPPAGIVLSQQSGRSRGHAVDLPDSGSQTVTFSDRRNNALVVHAYVPQPWPLGIVKGSVFPSVRDNT